MSNTRRGLFGLGAAAVATAAVGLPVEAKAFTKPEILLWVAKLHEAGIVSTETYVRALRRGGYLD
jgi:hypothetical protein